jgi:hypothetical protein
MVNTVKQMRLREELRFQGQKIRAQSRWIKYYRVGRYGTGKIGVVVCDYVDSEQKEHVFISNKNPWQTQKELRALESVVGKKIDVYVLPGNYKVYYVDEASLFD